MTPWELPSSLNVGGEGFAIRNDYRVILDLLQKMADPEYDAEERALIALQILYVEWEKIPPQHYEEALRRASEFIDAGIAKRGNGKVQPATMDWEQDAPLILPAVNRVLGADVRGMEYLHWWSFFGAYMEIRESLYSSVLTIRRKRAKGKTLEKHEIEFYNENKQLIDLQRTESEEKRAQLERLKKLRGKG